MISANLCQNFVRKICCDDDHARTKTKDARSRSKRREERARKRPDSRGQKNRDPSCRHVWSMTVWPLWTIDAWWIVTRVIPWSLSKDVAWVADVLATWQVKWRVRVEEFIHSRITNYFHAFFFFFWRLYKKSNDISYNQNFVGHIFFWSDPHMQLITWISCWLENNKCNPNMSKIECKKISHFFITPQLLSSTPMFLLPKFFLGFLVTYIDYTLTLELWHQCSSCPIFPSVFGHLNGMQNNT